MMTMTDWQMHRESSQVSCIGAVSGVTLSSQVAERGDRQA